VARRNCSRIIGAIVATVVVSLVLSGCAAIATAVDRSLVSARIAAKNVGRPLVGECWRASFKSADGYANWDDSPPVKCSEPHELYSFVVTDLTEPHKGKLFDKAGYAYTPIWDDAYQACSQAEGHEFSNLDVNSRRDTLETYLPEEAQWDIGARWVRCDIGVLAVGSSVAHPEFEALPSLAVLRHEVAKAPEQFDFCTDIPAGATGGPKGPDAVYADCLDKPQWVFQNYYPLDSGPDGEYPDAAVRNAQYVRQCESQYADATHQTYVYYPSTKEWSNDNVNLECWVGIKG
jgi:hypothetical protein